MTNHIYNFLITSPTQIAPPTEQAGRPPQSEQTQTPHGQASSDIEGNARRQAARPSKQTAARRAGDNERGTSFRSTPRQTASKAERGTHDTRGRQWDGASREQATRTGDAPTRSHSKHKKKTGRGLFLIPVSHHYLMGIDFSEAPTTRSTCSFAAFLVLKP